MNTISFQLTSEYIELFKLLKMVKVCFSGGEAKICIEDEMVFVNNELETRKRYKVRTGDVVEFEGNLIEVK